MPFVAIHNVNSHLHVAWPAKMRIIRVELVHVLAGAFGMGYGILSAPSADEENSTAHLGRNEQRCVLRVGGNAEGS
jgi:hypothetical protein